VARPNTVWREYTLCDTDDEGHPKITSPRITRDASRVKPEETAMGSPTKEMTSAIMPRRYFDGVDREMSEELTGAPPCDE